MTGQFHAPACTSMHPVTSHMKATRQRKTNNPIVPRCSVTRTALIHRQSGRYGLCEVIMQIVQSTSLYRSMEYPECMACYEYVPRNSVRLHRDLLETYRCTRHFAPIVAKAHSHVCVHTISSRNGNWKRSYAPYSVNGINQKTFTSTLW